MTALMTKKDIERFMDFLAQAIPEPETELNYKNPYTLLIATILSAQATDVSVNKATKELFKSVDNPEAMIRLGEEALKTHIKSIGLYNAKAVNIMRCSEQLISLYSGQVPANLKALEGLAGVGRKTANVVLNVAFGQPTIAVDTHLFRVANRTGLAPGKTPLAVEAALLKRIPKKYHLRAHHWLILFGRYTCLARNPKCKTCGIVTLCRFQNKQL